MSVAPLHPEIIRSRIRMRFGTIAAFEDAKGLPTRSVSDVLRGRSVRRAEEAIAQELDLELHQVSSRYVVPKSTDVDDSASEDGPHRLNAGAR